MRRSRSASDMARILASKRAERKHFARILAPVKRTATSTDSVHAGEPKDHAFDAIPEPIVQTSTYSFADTKEIVDLTPSYGGISYERLETEALQWPCPTKEHPGTPLLHKDTFSRGKGRFMPLEYKPPAEMPDEEYPLILTTERSLYHYHTSTMTRKVKGLNKLRPEELVEINPADATKLGVSDGQQVKVVSRRGEVKAKAKVTQASPPGVVSMTFHFAESPTNQLTNPALDPVAKIPELKVCAVRVEKSDSIH